MGFILNTSFQPTSGFLNLNVSTAPTGYSVNYALIGGGGAGGGNWGGGGGAGQVVRSTTNLAFSTLYNIFVGTGVTGTAFNTPPTPQANPSIFATSFAYGGGSGGDGLNGYTNGNNGGSGGGAASGYSVNLTNTLTSYGGTSIGGYAGGDSIAPRISGGGGGAGSVGGSGTLTGSGNGGAGVAITIAGYSAGTFAGGGGGGSGQSYTAGTGGSGGGGNGAAGINVSGGNATANTGSGGGGNSGGGGGVGGSGASGIVILSIPTASYPGDSYVNGGVADSSVWTKTTSGSNTILTFKKDSTYASSAGYPTSFTYPTNILTIGGGGAGGDYHDDIGSGTGGNGGQSYEASASITTGQVITISVGLGGQMATFDSNNNISTNPTSGQSSVASIGGTEVCASDGGTNGSTLTDNGQPYLGGNGNNIMYDDVNPNNDKYKGSGINGGNGYVSTITGTSTYYGGGGAGQTYAGSYGTNGLGALGIGGKGGTHGTGYPSTAGDNGAVILAIPILRYTGKTNGNPLVSYDSSNQNVILTYRNSGNYTA
jgi:hypothetical protein